MLLFTETFLNLPSFAFAYARNYVIGGPEVLGSLVDIGSGS